MAITYYLSNSLRSLAIPMQSELSVQHHCSKTRLSTRVTVRRSLTDSVQIDYLDWSGCEFELEIDLNWKTARFRNDSSDHLPAADALMRSICRSVVALLRAKANDFAER
jgi:hypothetical protein